MRNYKTFLFGFGKIFLTSNDLGDRSLCQGRVLCQLLPEALTHVVIYIIRPQQLLEGLCDVENLSKFKDKAKIVTLILFPHFGNMQLNVV